MGSTWATPEVVVAAALGAAFVEIADTSDPDRNRLAGLALTHCSRLRPGPWWAR